MFSKSIHKRGVIGITTILTVLGTIVIVGAATLFFTIESQDVPTQEATEQDTFSQTELANDLSDTSKVETVTPEVVKTEIFPKPIILESIIPKPEPEQSDELPDLVAMRAEGRFSTVVHRGGWGYESITVNGIVKNQGKATSGTSKVSVRVDKNQDKIWDIIPDVISVHTLRPGDSKSVTWKEIKDVNFSIVEICADANNDIKESDETNNCVSIRSGVYY